MIIVVEGNRTTVKFLGKTLSRHTYMIDFMEFLVRDYLGLKKTQYSNAFVHIMLEAVKNIYDHGNGKATIILIQDHQSITFDLKDGNSKKISFLESSDLSKWKKVSGHNCGHGLGLIKNHYSNFVTDFIIDDSKGGINYSGKIPFEKE